MYNYILESSVFGDRNENETDLLSEQFRVIVGSIIVLVDSFSVTELMFLLLAWSDMIDITFEPLKPVVDISNVQNTNTNSISQPFFSRLSHRQRTMSSRTFLDRSTSKLIITQHSNAYVPCQTTLQEYLLTVTPTLHES